MHDRLIAAITYSDLATTIPFENSVDTFDLLGEHLKLLFEFSVRTIVPFFDSRYFIQISGLFCYKYCHCFHDYQL